MPMISSLLFNAKNLAVNRHVYYIQSYNFMYKNVFLNIFFVLLKQEWLTILLHWKSGRFVALPFLATFQTVSAQVVARKEKGKEGSRLLPESCIRVQTLRVLHPSYVNRRFIHLLAISNRGSAWALPGQWQFQPSADILWDLYCNSKA